MSLKNAVSKLKKEEIAREEQEILNREMIAYQNDEPFLNEATAAIEKIVEVGGINNSNLNKPEGLKAVSVLEDLFTKRFGCKVIFGTNNERDCYTVVNGPFVEYDYNFEYNLYTLFKSIDDFKSKYPKDYEAMINGDLDLSDPKYRDVNTWYAKLGNIKFLSILDKIKNGGFTLDIKNAKLVNAPKNMSVYINIDWYARVVTPNLTAKHALAICLHEFGHNWDHIERLYRVFSNIAILNDVIMEEYAKKNKTPTEAIRIFYNTANIDMPKDMPKDIVGVSIQAYKDIIRGISVMHTSNQYQTDKEQQADEFAGRFGLSKYLSESFATHGAIYDNRGYELYDLKMQLKSSSWLGAGIASVAAYAAFAAGAATGPAILLALGVGGIVTLVKTICTSIDTMTNLYDKVNAKYLAKYDNLDRRIKRIRNTAIRRMANITNNDVKKQILKDIEDIDKALEPVYAYLQNNKMRKIAEYFYSKTEAYNEYKLIAMIEDLNANEIHVASALWNTK